MGTNTNKHRTMSDEKDLQKISPEPIETSDNGPNKPPSRLLPFLQGVQRYSSYTFSAFLTLHGVSVIAMPLVSPEIGNYTVNFTGSVYQEQLIEPFLVYGALGAHVTSGIILRLRSTYLYYKQHERLPKLPSNLALSGYMIAPLVLGHILATRWMPVWELGDSSIINLDFIAHTLHKLPISTFIALTTLVGGVSYHVVNGWRRWLGAQSSKAAFRGYIAIAASTVAGAISIIRINSLPETFGWVANQFDQVLRSLYVPI